MLRRWRVMVIILAVIAAGYGVITIGCSKEDLTGALDKAKKAVTDGVEVPKQIVQDTMDATADQVKKELDLAGSFDLTAGDPLKAKACYVTLISQGDRPTVLQLQSYRDMDSDSPPFVFLQAQVQANSLAELVGEPLAARLFVQRDSNGPILFSDVSTPVEFKITAIEENLVSFELIKATLRDTTTGAQTPVTGSMTGVLE